MSHFKKAHPEIEIPFMDRPLQLVTVPDRVMEPELYPGQQVFVQAYRDARTRPNYHDQTFALELHGREVVRRVQAVPGGGLRLWGPRSDKQRLHMPPDPWLDEQRERGYPWIDTGEMPGLRLIGPILKGYVRRPEPPYRHYEPVTAGWSN